MYWSNYSLEEYAEILAEVGFSLLETTTTSKYEDASKEISEDHPLVLARKQ